MKKMFCIFAFVEREKEREREGLLIAPGLTPVILYYNDTIL